jgi:TonB-linked SusC/RagA family outer membrane protein
MAYAQDRTVSGRVTAAEDGAPLPGVNVVLKGTSNGVVTDAEGRYQLSGIPASGGTLVFSFIGLKTQEVEIGQRSVVDVQMASAIEELSEVIVTAQGITREKASLGFGVATLKAEESLFGRQEVDIARLLRGKATGVDINATSGLAGSGTNIIIRGYTSLTGSNQPLFIVDGIPFNTATNAGNQDFTTGSATASSRFLDLDPNSIEDIVILKGLSATVLYGEAGRNGVILVTTKAGKAGSNTRKKTEITLNQGTYISQVANLPDYQNTYGIGFNSGFGWFFSNWGPAFNDLAPSSYGSDFRGVDNGVVLVTHPYDQPQYADDFPEYAGARYEYKPYRSVENFFGKGISSNTSLSISTSINQNTSVTATYSFLSEEGLTPRYGYYTYDRTGGNFTPIYHEKSGKEGRSNYIDKHNLGIGFSTQLQNGLKIRSSYNFVDTDRENPITGPAFGGDGNGLFAAIMFTPRSVDLMGLPFQSPIDGSNVYYRRGSPIQNPRWTLNNSAQHENVRRFFSSTDLSYKITDFLTAAYRISLDTYTQVNQRHINKGGSHVPDGEMRTFNVRRNTVDHVFNLLYDFKLPNDFSLNGTLGFNSRRNTRNETGLISTQQFVYGIKAHNNFINHRAYSDFFEFNTNGLYLSATLGYKTWLYLNMQARNDWTSLLEKQNRSVFYPSASLAFLPSDLFNLTSFDNLKFRLSYGTSAGYPDPYQTRTALATNTNVFESSGGVVLNTNSVSNVLGNPNLKPELHNELEFGIESTIKGGLIGIDLNLYNKLSKDLIITLPLDPSTGYDFTTVNGASIRNKGIELALNINPLRRGNIKWNNTFNFTRNISNVESIIAGVDQVTVAGYSDLGNVAIPGKPYGVLYGSAFLRSPDGFLVVDQTGQYLEAGLNKVIGDPNPDFTLSWISNLSWKGFSFGFTWQYTHGGDMYSSTVQALLARGNTKDTDVDRRIPIVLPNAVKQVGTTPGGEPIYAPNDIQTYMGDTFFSTYFGASESGVFDATVIRLREVSLSYKLPASALSKTPFGRVVVTLSGENLFYNAPNFPKGINFDPEINSLGVGNGRGFDFRTAPTVKKYGLNVNITF